MNIRVATPQDSSAIASLAIAFRNHLQRAVPTDASFLQSIEKLLSAEDAEFYICELNEKPVGYVLQRFRHSMWAAGTEAQIEDLYVDPAHRQSGFGKKLIDFAVQRAQKKACTTVCLDTNENNVASQKIYKAIGFNSFSARWKGNQIFYRLGLA